MTQRMPATVPYPGTPTIIDGHYFGKRGGAVVEANLSLIRDAWGSLLDVTAAVAASSQAATAADPLTDEEERLRGEVPGTSASPRSLVEAGR